MNSINNLSNVFDSIELIEDDIKYISNERVQEIIPFIKLLSLRFAMMEESDAALYQYNNLINELNNDEKIYVYDLMQRYVMNLLNFLTDDKILSKKRER